MPVVEKFNHRDYIYIYREREREKEKGMAPVEKPKH